MKSKSHLLALFLLTGVLLALVLQVMPPGKPKAKLNYEKLVADLVNRNPEPENVQSFGSRATFSKDYNWNEVTRVDKSLQKIIDNFDEAWPTLVKHVNDKEYSFTAHVEFEVDYDFNYSIGEICRELLRENLTELAMKFDAGVVEWKTFRRARFILDTKEDPNKFQNWFKEQIEKQRKFYQMQATYAESAIDFVPKKYFEYSDTKDYLLRAVESFKKEIEQVKVRKKPLLIKRFWISDGVRYIIKSDPNIKK